MPKARLHLLSSLQIERLQTVETDQMLNDGGGLYLFNRRHGSKEWIFRYSSPLSGQRRKQSLGTYPDTSLKQARALASSKRDIISRGLDPIVEMQKHRQIEITNVNKREEYGRNTVKVVFQAWKRAELQNRKDKGDEIERAFEKDVFPVIGNKVIGEVTRNDIKFVLERPLKRHVNRMANRLLSDLKQFFGYAEDEELTHQDPTRRLIKDRVGGKEKSRQRYLDQKELKLLAGLLPVSGLKAEYQHLIWLLLATGCRVNEILRARWSHVDWENRFFHIPSELSKNTLKHVVFLSDFALWHLARLKATQTTEWIVPNRSGTGPITRQVLTKQVTDRQQKTLGNQRVNNPQALILPNGRWVIHDLRRTAGTLMQEIGILPYIIKKCLNQKTEDKIIETYQRAALTDHQQEAFHKLGSYLDQLTQTTLTTRSV